MIILDTDHLTVIQRQNEPAYSNLRSRLDAVSSTEIYTTIISYEEQMRGWLTMLANSKNATQEIAVYQRLYAFLTFFKKISVLNYDVDAEALFSNFRQMKIRIGSMDLKIAAITISQNGLLLSRNLIDFQQVPGLQVEDWTK